MNDIIEKTNNLISVFEKSDLIKNLEYYKAKVIMNKKLLELINKYNNSNDEYEKISLKKEIFSFSNNISYEEISENIAYYS